MCLAPLRWVKGRRDRSYWKRRIRRMSATLIESRMNGHGAENNNVAGQYQKVATGRAYRLPREHNGNRRLESIPPEGSLRPSSNASGIWTKRNQSRQLSRRGTNRSTDQRQQGTTNTKTCHSQVSVQSYSYSYSPILGFIGAVRRTQDQGNRSKGVNLKQLTTPNVDRVCPATRYAVPAA
ncbi:hypothetical protein H106_08873 [Trichophyton rubrum CBS 735.88]|nr:hypothetical protein H106_08873 [Trichophyton rubrum CBS 735.88]